MHELSIAQEMIRIIEAERANHAFTIVEVVRIRAGSLSGIDPRALEFAFEVTRAETCAAGARLEVEAELMQILCQNCGRISPAEAGPRNCPDCKSLDLRLQGSTYFEILSLDVN